MPEIDLSAWIAARSDMNYTVAKDTGSRKTIEAFMKPGQRQALPTGESFFVTYTTRYPDS
jgi:hypothetical protein